MNSPGYKTLIISSRKVYICHYSHNPAKSRYLSMARIERSAFATVISIFFVILYVGVFIASMVALGYTVDTERDIEKINKPENCILQVNTGGHVSSNDHHVIYKGNSRCDFIIGGNAVLLIILSVIRAIFGKW